jgi:hypothetical protein
MQFNEKPLLRNTVSKLAIHARQERRRIAGHGSQVQDSPKGLGLLDPTRRFHEPITQRTGCEQITRMRYSRSDQTIVVVLGRALLATSEVEAASAALTACCPAGGHDFALCTVLQLAVCR